MAQTTLMSHEEVERILRGAGYPQERIGELLSQFPDPIDLERDREALFSHGISLGTLMDRMGASP